MFANAQYHPPSTDTDHLKGLVSVALRALQTSIVEVNYPDELRRKALLEVWESRYKEIDLLNESLLASVQARAGVYVILKAKTDQDWQLCYIGQAKASVARQRARSHLIWRNKSTPSGRSTGSKFDEVRIAVNSGQQVAFSFVEISPPSLRHFVESTLIDRFYPEWNFHGTSSSGIDARRKFCIWSRSWPDDNEEAKY